MYLDLSTVLYNVGYINVRARTLFPIESYKPRIEGLAYDNFNEDVYITFENKINVIKNYDSVITSRTEMITKLNAKAKQIQIDSPSRLLFVIEDSKEIIKVNLTDGSKFALLNQSVVEIRSITIDTVGEKVFWVSGAQSPFIVEMVNYDGTCRKWLQAVKSSTPQSITFWNGTLFWSDNGKKIYKTLVKNGDTELTGIPLQYIVLALDFYGKVDYTGTWTSWVESQTKEGVLQRTCSRPPLPYYREDACLLQSNEKKFVCNGPSRKNLDPVPIDDSKVSVGVIVGASIGGIVFLIMIAIIVKVYYDNTRKLKQPHPPPIQYENSFQQDIDFGTYQTGLSHIYQTIPELQQELKEKGLKDGGFHPNDSSTRNHYLTSADLRVKLPDEKPAVQEKNSVAQAEANPYQTGFDTSANGNVAGAMAVNSEHQPPSQNDYKNMIESNRLSV